MLNLHARALHYANGRMAVIFSAHMNNYEFGLAQKRSRTWTAILRKLG